MLDLSTTKTLALRLSLLHVLLLLQQLKAFLLRNIVGLFAAGEVAFFIECEGVVHCGSHSLRYLCIVMSAGARFKTKL